MDLQEDLVRSLAEMLDAKPETIRAEVEAVLSALEPGHGLNYYMQVADYWLQLELLPLFGGLQAALQSSETLCRLPAEKGWPRNEASWNEALNAAREHFDAHHVIIDLMDVDVRRAARHGINVAFVERLKRAVGDSANP